MSFFTKQQFESVARLKAGNRGLNANLSDQRTFSKSYATTSIFLSHAHNDRAIVEQAKVFFENIGITIYVDWADETMPEKPNGITASNIKAKIKSNSKFILLATNSAVISKWCNWEVGLGDAAKFEYDKICILPLSENSLSWNGNEYLQIYPRIEVPSNSTIISNDDYLLVYPSGKVTSLTNWLRK